MKYHPMAPLLRGALRTGEVGPLVRTIEPEKLKEMDPLPPTELKLSVSPKTSAAHKAQQALQAVREFRKKHGTDPQVVNAGSEGCFEIQYSGHKKGRLAGRIALVTGGAQGFGEEIAHHLVHEDAFVYIADLNIEKAQQLSTEINRKANATVSGALPVDVSDEDSVQALSTQIALTSGGLDLLISNAGVLKAGSLKTLKKKDFDFVTSVNYTAYFLCVKHFAPLMALQNLADGQYYTDIIQINSKSGLQGSNRNSAYAGGKFGGIGLTQSFALELVEDNIKVNSICPGNFFESPLWSNPKDGLFLQYLNTGKVPGAKTLTEVKAFYESKVPMGRGCRGKDVATAIYYVVEQKYETGQAIPVTGGQMMLN